MTTFSPNYRETKKQFIRSWFPYENLGYVPIIQVSLHKISSTRKRPPMFFLNSQDIRNDGFYLYHTEYSNLDFEFGYLLNYQDKTSVMVRSSVIGAQSPSRPVGQDIIAKKGN